MPLGVIELVAVDTDGWCSDRYDRRACTSAAANDFLFQLSRRFSSIRTLHFFIISEGNDRLVFVHHNGCLTPFLAVRFKEKLVRFGMVQLVGLRLDRAPLLGDHWLDLIVTLRGMFGEPLLAACTSGADGFERVVMISTQRLGLLQVDRRSSRLVNGALIDLVLLDAFKCTDLVVVLNDVLLDLVGKLWVRLGHLVVNGLWLRLRVNHHVLS